MARPKKMVILILAVVVLAFNANAFCSHFEFHRRTIVQCETAQNFRDALIRGKVYNVTGFLCGNEGLAQNLVHNSSLPPLSFIIIASYSNTKKRVLAQALLENKADVNGRDREGCSALCMAVKENNQEMVDFLLKQNASISKGLLSLATENSNRPITRLLLAHKADPTPQAAALLGNVRMLQQLLESETPPLVSALDAALPIAIGNFYTDVAGMLITHGATHTLFSTIVLNDVQGLDGIRVFAAALKIRHIFQGEEMGMLELAAHLDRTDILSRLLELNADINSHQGAPVRRAVLSGNTKALQLLIEHKASLNAVDKRGQNLIILSLNHKEKIAEGMIALLLENGINARQADVQGDTAVAHAAFSGQLRSLALLLAATADIVDQPNNDGQTPLITAVRFYDLDVVKKLLEAGADVNYVDHTGRTALHWLASMQTSSRKKGHKGCQIIEALIHHKADVHKNSRRRRSTPLEAAERVHKSDEIWIMWLLTDPKMAKLIQAEEGNSISYNGCKLRLPGGTCDCEGINHRN